MIISDGFYSVYYNLWKKYFGDNILLVDGTNILKNPADEIIKIQKFLKIPVELTRQMVSPTCAYTYVTKP